MSKCSEGSDIVALAGLETTPGDAKKNVVEAYTKGDETYRKKRESRFQQIGGPGSCGCDPHCDPSNANEPEDPFYEFFAKE